MGRITKRISPISWSGAPTLTFQQGTADQFDLGNYLRNTQNKSVTYAVVGQLPSGVSLVGRFVSYDGNGAAASSSVTFTATIPGWTVTSPSVTCTIQASTNPVNTPPYWDASTPAGFTILQGSTVGTIVADFANYARDDEGDEITYTIAGLPSFLQAQGSRVVVASSVPTTTDSYTVTVNLAEAVTTTGDLPTLTVSSSTGAWTFGQPIKKGAATWLQGPAGTQVDIRNRWPDGSAKFAVISGVNVGSVTLTQALSNPYTATPIATSALSGTTAQIDFGAASVTFGTTEWASPFRTVASGPVMSSWVYRKAFSGDSHLVAWLEVRRYSNGQVEVLPWIENGYLNVAGPATKSGRAKFTLNGTLKYDSINDPDYTVAWSTPVTAVSGGVVNIYPFCRCVLVNSNVVAHWSSGSSLTPSHDRTYFRATKVVPNYDVAAPSEASLALLDTATYSPMRTYKIGNGNYALAGLVEPMTATGYAAHIGLLPSGSVYYLTSGDPRAYRAAIKEAYSLGAFAIHRRDETTNRIPLMASYPTHGLNDAAIALPTPASSAYVGAYGASHHPSASYVPYLLTGWNYHVEEMQFQHITHYFATTTAARRNSSDYYHFNNAGYGMASQAGVRAMAWRFRTAATVVSITPEAYPSEAAGDTAVRAQFATSFNYNCTTFYNEHHPSGVGSPQYPWARNNLGFIHEPGWEYSALYSTVGEKIGSSTWTNDFFTQAVGLAWDLDVATGQAKTDLLALRNWLYSGIVGRLGPTDGTGYNYRRAAQYSGISTALTTGSATSFNWYTTWQQVYQQNGGDAGPFGQDGGGSLSPGTFLVLHNPVEPAIEVVPAHKAMQEGYWANLRPAIAYALQHEAETPGSAPGIVAGWNRILSATRSTGGLQWEACLAGDHEQPIWAVKPR